MKSVSIETDSGVTGVTSMRKRFRWPINAEGDSHFTVKARIVTAAFFALASPYAFAQDDAADLAKKLSNPIAALISVPLQLNYDDNIGPGERGDKWQLNVQPVIPITLNKEWNLISRTIVPIINQKNVSAPGVRNSGIGDVVQSFFFSPLQATATGWIWGVGPVLMLRTGEDNLSGEKWGGGPTAVVLKQQSGWTYGALANHIWSFAGSDSARDISATFVQPFMSFTTKSATTYGLNTESTYDWRSEKWSVPINATVSQLIKVGSQPLSVGGGVRYWVSTPDNVGPKGWGFRVFITALFPK
ncbi:MAG: transporter [Burkholderiaceae bacterium]